MPRRGAGCLVGEGLAVGLLAVGVLAVGVLAGGVVVGGVVAGGVVVGAPVFGVPPPHPASRTPSAASAARRVPMRPAFHATCHPHEG